MPPHDQTASSPESLPPLPARTAVPELALRAVRHASLAMARLTDADAALPHPDPDRVAVAYASERHLRVHGERPDIWSALSGFFPTRSGWLRTHGNYAHHALALTRALLLPSDADQAQLAAALSRMSALAAERLIVRAGGVAARVREEVPVRDAALRESPLVATRRLGAHPRHPLPGPTPSAPLRGIRVLDLTRVIAGPIATRTLALSGADVLRIDPVTHPEAPWQHLDTGHGKRSALLDLREAAAASRLHELLGRADVVVYGYRPDSAARWGLDPRTLAARHPGIVVARLSAWGFERSARSRRGFDSIVQAASGIARVESGDGVRPGALPVQALDHSAGYLLAAGVMRALARRRDEGGSWLVQTSLRRMAAELLGMPRLPHRPRIAEPDPTPHLQDFVVAGTAVTTAAPAPRYPGGPTRFDPPRPWGQDEPRWA
ncbi:CoA transferase [Microbacterium limosum]|uniref:CoA transferase n=1 Tax=Microbacterium limosum TaxID=3079935 RepID=A0AAU0MKU3_9MICO|nr:CoA transferase [Microbacterium sp. Y20]WOQ70368.1 CoA transferase [Microbacterium sp. Y20]